MSTETELLKTPLYDLHVTLGARMVPFAGYSMPVQYPTGLVAEHHHTRQHAGLFDVSHMGQLRLLGADAAAAFETLMPVDVIDLPVGKQRYGLLTNEGGGIIDDLMFFKVADDEIFVIVNGACKANDIAHIQKHIGQRCKVETFPTHGLLALQGPQAVTVLQRLCPGVEKLVFMTGGRFNIAGTDCFVTRSGYTGEDGFEISVSQAQTEMLAKALLAEAEVKPIGLGARNSLRLEAGLCLYGQDIDTSTNPVEANLGWAMQKARRADGARAGGYLGATNIIAAQAINTPATGQKDHINEVATAHTLRKRVGLVAIDRVPVREHTELQDTSGNRIGEVTSGLLSPTLDKPIAMGYVNVADASIGTRINALVRGKVVVMEVAAMPFVPNKYFRG
ncbi:MAG TPA: glycine cleavage system aminomethyltransferase GcvT [Burkholderiaceae bacterium]|nr:glycine cleavage system aminomethyltransferase GcvT [Burkholderiaceae bacterium]